MWVTLDSEMHKGRSYTYLSTVLQLHYSSCSQPEPTEVAKKDKEIVSLRGPQMWAELSFLFEIQWNRVLWKGDRLAKSQVEDARWRKSWKKKCRGVGKARFNVATPTYEARTRTVTCTAYVLPYNFQTKSISREVQGCTSTDFRLK